MTYISTSAGVEFQSGTTVPAVVTVQAGITASNYCYLVVAGATGAGDNITAPTATPVKAGSSFTLWRDSGPTSDNNQWFNIFEVTDLVAADVINVSTSANRSAICWLVAFTTRLPNIGTRYARAGASLTTTVAPAMACSAGQKIICFGIERNITVGTTISSFVNSNARAVTSDFYAKATATGGQISLYIAEFIETSTDTGTTTATYTAASGNGSSWGSTEAVLIVAIGNKSNDVIMAELIAAGYVNGTINDRERARLLVLTGAPSVGNTIMDLYALAGEKPRLI